MLNSYTFMTFKRTVYKRFWRWAYARAPNEVKINQCHFETFDQVIVNYETFETLETSRLKNSPVPMHGGTGWISALGLMSGSRGFFINTRVLVIE